MSSDAPAKRRNPAWIPPFLGRVPAAVDDGQLRLLGAVAFAIFFENYDQAMLTQAIKQIVADFGVAEAEIGNLLGTVRLGALPAIALLPFADRFGRRRTFLASVLVMSAATTLCAFAPDVRTFLGLQMLSRLAMVIAAATAFVIVAEEFHAEHRGWGIGVLGALGAFGVGLSAMVFAAIEVLPYGWRAMYLLGAAPALAFPLLRRSVTETRRFGEQARATRASGNGFAEWWRPLTRLAGDFPGRSLAVATIGFCATAAIAVAYNFSAYFVQEEHGWAPGQYSAMLLIAGLFGVLGHPIAGRLADRFGRRPVGFVFYTTFPMLSLGFYTGPSWALPALWIPMSFALSGGLTVARALAAELFPTAYRGTASGLLQLTDTLGSAAGLFAVSALSDLAGGAIPALRWVVWVSLLASVAVLLVPETGRRELEQIAGEDDAESG